MVWTDDDAQKHFKSQLEKQCLHHTPPGVTVLAAKPTCCHQDTALGIYNPLTQRVRGEACKLRHETVRSIAAVRTNYDGLQRVSIKRFLLSHASCDQNFFLNGQEKLEHHPTDLSD